MSNKKLSEDLLLEMVIEYFIKYGSPIGSKFLFELKEIDMAPSTIRKYLNSLEKKGLLYQPYNSAGRVPTIDGINKYISNLLPLDNGNKNLIKINQSFNLRGFIEKISEFIDGVVFGYFEDEIDIYYIGVAQILKKVGNDIEKIIPLMEFIEKKEIITYLSKKQIDQGKINYSFVNYNGTNIALMYIKVSFESRPAIIGIVGGLRVNYKENITILEKILSRGKI